MISNQKLEDLLIDITQSLSCDNTTRSYIVSIFKRNQRADLFDLGQYGVGLVFCQARERKNFAECQNIGDWLFFCRTMFPESLRFASEEYYNNIARLSYYTCYQMMRSWRVYEQLADEYILLTEQTRDNLIKMQSR
jgi:hypothetical protein